MNSSALISHRSNDRMYSSLHSLEIFTLLKSVKSLLTIAALQIKISVLDKVGHPPRILISSSSADQSSLVVHSSQQLFDIKHYLLLTGAGPAAALEYLSWWFAFFYFQTYHSCRQIANWNLDNFSGNRKLIGRAVFLYFPSTGLDLNTDE